jgi:hypothetical protein
MEIYLSREGTQYGPYSVEQLNEMLAAEQITGQDMFWYEGREDWAQLSQMPGYEEPRKAGPPPPPPGPPAAMKASVPRPAAPSPGDAALPGSDPGSTASRGGSYPRQAASSGVLGWVMVLIPIFGAFLVWWTDADNAQVMAPVILVTAILAGVEAKRLGMGRNTDSAPGRAIRYEGVNRYGPWNWGFFVLLLWIIGYPAYLYRRSRYGAQNLLLPGLIAATCLIAAASFSGSALPQVDSPEVLSVAQQALRESPVLKLLGVDQASISSAGEIRYDPVKQRRVARALLKTPLGNETAYYTVEWQDRSKGSFWVQFRSSEKGDD